MMELGKNPHIWW